MLNELLYLHRSISRKPYKINPTWQCGDIKLCFGFGDLASDYFPTLHVEK